MLSQVATAFEIAPGVLKSAAGLVRDAAVCNNKWSEMHAGLASQA